MERFNIKSLLTKFALIGILVISLMASLLYLDASFGSHMSEEAKRVNLAGRQRMLMRSISYNVRSFTEFIPSSGEEMFRESAKKAIKEYEDALLILKEGNEDLNPIPGHDTGSIQQLDSLIKLWKDTQKPALVSIMNLPPSKKVDSCNICHNAIRDNLGAIDSLVQSIQDHHIAEIERFKRIRILFLGILFFLNSLILIYFKKTLISPILRLRDSTKEIEKGNFDVRVDIRGRDEVSELAGSFNKMAETISSDYRRIEALSSFPEKSPNPIFECDCDGNIIYTNPAAENFIKDCGIKVTDMLPFGICEIAYGMKEGKESMRYHTVKAGNIIFGEFIHFLPDTELIRVYAYDITEHKKIEDALMESEIKYRTLVEDIPAVTYIAAIDPKFSRIYISPQIVPILGFPMSDWISDPDLWYRQLHNDDRDASIKKFAGNTAAEEPFALDYRIISREGRIVWFHDKAKLIRNKSGMPIYYEGFMQDITAEKELEGQLRQAQKMEAIGTLTGGVVHDFSNMLTAIIGYGTLLQMKIKDGDSLRGYADQILAAAEKAANLTQSLLAFSRKKAVDFKPVNLNDCVIHIEKLLKRLIGEDIEFRSSLSDSDIIINADAGQIEQVLMNLCTNASHAMPAGGALMIETDLIELGSDFMRVYGYGKPGSYALLSVSDTGTGMDEDTKKRIFEPFFTTKEAGKGTGLGLAIVYGIIKQHKGYINVCSEPGNGTSFKIYIPLLKETEGQGLIRHKAQPLTGGNETILLADDDAGARHSTRIVLEEFGYKVIEAVDGEDAVNKFRDGRASFSLLMLDVIMPRKTGKEVYDEIKKTNPGIPVVFTSGYTEDIVQKKGLFGEGINYISKPASVSNLLKTIRDVLNKKT